MSEAVSNQVVMVSADKLRPHPDNPRKNLGDLSELTESIKENGILQNLTVVPDPDKGKDEEGYLIVIGHRRNAAGIAAGLDEFPCVVRDLTHADQIKMMLCENIQRNDLTVMEQAQGFQMMIDFGITVEDLAKDTGFARSTIYHRLNIAKLDPDIVESKQFTITELIELEKIEDVETRNKILANADNITFLSKVNQAYREQETEKIKSRLIEKLQEAGLEEREERSWNHNLKIKETYNVNPKLEVDSIALHKEDEDGNNLGNFKYYYISQWNELLLYDLKSEAEMEEDLNNFQDQPRVIEIKNEISDKLDLLKGLIQDAVEDAKSYKQYALKKVAKMSTQDYNQLLTDSLLLISIHVNEMGYISVFEPESYEIETWNRDDSYEEFFIEMKSALEHQIDQSPFSYLYEYLMILLQEANNILPFQWEVMNRGSVNLNDDNVFVFKMVIELLERTGYSIKKGAQQVLDEQHKALKKVRELAQEYKELKESK